MKLINKTKKKTISNNIYTASSFLDATFGLIRKKDQDLHFTTRFGIHTLFMKMEIDVIIADSNFEIVKIKKELKSNRIFLWNPKYSNVFELKKGSIVSSGTSTGDKLSLVKDSSA